MDGTRDSHTKRSKPEREKQIPYDTTYMWNLKYGTDNPILKRNGSWPRRADLGFPRGKGEGVGQMSIWGVFWIQTVIFGMVGQWYLTVQHREMCVIGSFYSTTELEETL